MKVTLSQYSLKAEKQKGDKPIYTESGLLHAIKKELIKQGHDVIKKRMSKDGHLYGDNTTQYIRTRDTKENRIKGGFYVYDGDYAIRISFKDYNKDGFILLNVETDIYRDAKTKGKEEKDLINDVPVVQGV